MQDFSKTRYFIGVVFLIVLSFTGGIFFGIKERTEIEKIVGVSNKELPVDITNVDFSPFWKAWNTIDKKFPGSSKISSQDRVYGAISGLMSSLDDPYSIFFTPDQSKSFQSQIAGNFSGVGMEVGFKDDILTVIAPLKDTPAFKAGIKPGDKILKIDDKSTQDITTEDAVKLIRGEKGTEVRLTVFHVGATKSEEIRIVRDNIEIPTLETEVLPDGIFVIRLFSFSANASKLFQGALKEFALSKTDKLVLDLRGNPGGYLDAAVFISSWFLPEGKVIVKEDYGGEKEPVIYRSSGFGITRGKNENPLDENLKFVILIDGGSASASEIVAGAMQDHKKALLVGEKSFGKGSVQEVINMTKDTIMKITVAKWLTPDGNTIAEKGLTPNYVVKYIKDEKNPKKDTQLDKAVQLLKNWPGIK